MSFVTFMGSHWPTLALSVAAAALSAFVLLVSGASVGLSLLVAGVVVGAGLLSIAIDYRRKRPFYGDLAACTDDLRRKRPFYGDLAACTDDLEHPLWIFEMVD